MKLRAHHLLCIPMYQGKGYSEGFTAHMGEMLKMLEKNVPVRLTADTDEICSACPNNNGGTCKEAEVVQFYDAAVLKACDLKEGQEIRFLEFAEQVQEKIIEPEIREKICGNCQWNEICSRKASRWAKG